MLSPDLLITESAPRVRCNKEIEISRNIYTKITHFLRLVSDSCADTLLASHSH